MGYRCDRMFIDEQCTHLGLRWLGSGGNKIMASSVFGGLAGFFTGSIASVWAEPALKRTAPLSIGSKGMGIIAGQFTWLAATVPRCWACMPLALAYRHERACMPRACVCLRGGVLT